MPCYEENYWICWLLYSFWADTVFNPLPALNADLSSLTMSGFGNGATMAMVMHVIHSDKIQGVGLVSGGLFGPYEEQKSVEAYQLSISAASDLASSSAIVSTDSIKDKPVYIQSQTYDK